MTDRTPNDARLGDDVPDDDGVQDLEVLRGLGFDALGGEAPFDGMDGVRARAAQQRRRRAWSVGAAAAAVLLVIGGLGVALARTGEESAPDIATQPTTAESQQMFLLPPTEATDVGFQLGLHVVRTHGDELPQTDEVNLYNFRYETPDGSMTVTVGRNDPVEGVDTLVGVAEGIAVAGDPVVPGIGTTFSTSGSFWMNCANESGPVSGGVLNESWSFQLRFDAFVDLDPCVSQELTLTLRAQFEQLRVVDEAEWRQYLQDHMAVNLLAPDMAATTLPPMSTAVVPTAR